MYDEDKSYYLVNPAGAIHILPHTLATQRLKTAGWRLATKEEIGLYIKAKGRQSTKHMIAKRWSPEPPKEQELPASAIANPKVKKAK